MWSSIVVQLIVGTIPGLVKGTFTTTDSKVLRSLFDYFESPFLNILEENPARIVALNNSLHAKNYIPTSVITVEQLLLHLGQKGNVRHGGLPLIALQQESSVWTKLMKLANEDILRSAKWVLFSKKPFTISTFSSFYIPFDCEFISVNHATALPLLTEVYYVLKNGSVETTHFGYWSAENGLSTMKMTFYQRRPDFKNYVFHAVIQNSPPYTYVTTDRLKQTVTYQGYFYEVWKELEFRLKFRTIFHVVDSPGRNYMEYLERKEYNFAVAPIAQEPKSAQRISLSEPIFEAKVFLFGQRPGSELEWNSYLKPFSTETWLVTLAWMLASSLALSILYWIAWRYRASEHEAEYYVFTFPIAFATVFRALCAQGSDVTPKSNSCRLLFLSVYTTALVLTSAFSAALFSLLTIPVTKAPFNTFQDVLNNKGYRIGILPSTDIHYGLLDLAERFPNSDISKLLKMLESEKNFPVDVPSALVRVCSENSFLFVWDLPNVLEGLRKLPRICAEKVVPGGPMLFKEMVGFGMSKGNPHKELIDMHILQLKNEGIIRRLFLNSWPPRIPNVPSSWMKVTVADISPIIYMFVFGVAAGVAILMCERLKDRIGRGSNLSRSAGKVLRNLRLGFHSEISPVAPISSLREEKDNWESRYTDWGEKETTTLHRRLKDKYR